MKEGNGFFRAVLHVLVWVMLVALFTAALVCAVVYYLYDGTDATKLPNLPVTFEAQTLEQCGYEWTLPVLGNRLTRSLSATPTTALQQLPPTASAHPAICVPAGTEAELVIENAAGEVVFEGDMAAYEGFALPGAGDYAAQIILTSDGTAKGATGRYLYRFAFSVQAQPVLQLSAARAKGGDVVGVRLMGSLCATPPRLETDLCATATFVADGDDWIAFLPVSLAAWAGDYPITAWVNGTETTATLNIYARSTTDRKAARSSLPYLETPCDALQPILEICDPERYWGSFAQPVSGKVLRDFAAIDTAKTQSQHIAFSVRNGTAVTAPAAGRVVLAENIGGQCGNTLVIEHGCGLKSIFYRLQSLDVAEGDSLILGDVVGSTGSQIICEMRLHGVPISPWSVWRNQGGAFWGS